VPPSTREPSATVHSSRVDLATAILASLDDPDTGKATIAPAAEPTGATEEDTRMADPPRSPDTGADPGRGEGMPRG
jgi:hypothetical protein